MAFKWSRYLGAGIGYYMGGAPGAIIGYILSRYLRKQVLSTEKDRSLDLYFKILRISPDATPQEIKRAYRQMVKAFHPDIHPIKKKDSCHKKMAMINEAYRRIRQAKNF
jgi:preprotein translocase subunit Sec63